MDLDNRSAQLVLNGAVQEGKSYMVFMEENIMSFNVTKIIVGMGIVQMMEFQKIYRDN